LVEKSPIASSQIGQVWLFLVEEAVVVSLLEMVGIIWGSGPLFRLSDNMEKLVRMHPKILTNGILQFLSVWRDWKCYSHSYSSFGRPCVAIIFRKCSIILDDMADMTTFTSMHLECKSTSMRNMCPNSGPNMELCPWDVWPFPKLQWSNRWQLASDENIDTVHNDSLSQPDLPPC